MVWLICNWTESRTVEQPLVSRDLYPRNCYLPCLQGLLRSNTYTVYILNRSYLPYSPILSINRLFLKRHTLLLSAPQQISFKSPRKPRRGEALHGLPDLIFSNSTPLVKRLTQLGRFSSRRQGSSSDRYWPRKDLHPDK